MEISITAIIVAITVLTSLYFFQYSDKLREVTFNPYAVKHQNQWYRVFTHALVHADFIHLFVNMYVLYSFGSFVEQFFPANFYIVLYIGGIIVASIPALIKHHNNPYYSSLGASGAVASVLFAAILINPSGTLLLMAIIPIPAWVFGFLYLGFEVYMNKKSNDNIAHDAHFYGALWGIVFTGYLNFELITSFFDNLF